MIVLAIDDDNLSQTLLKSALQSKFTVFSEQSGSRAVATAEACAPGIILLDINMPNVDGYEVLMQLKHHPLLSQVPVICLSGKRDEASRTRAYSLGASGFLVKPVDVETLAGDVEQIVFKLNTVMTSTDGTKKIFIGRNAATEREKIKASLNDAVALGKKVVMLSFLDPQTFFEPHEEALLHSGQVAFLQIKPGLLARLPYLQEVGSIVEDIHALTESQMLDTVLFVDGVERLINLSDRTQSLRVGLSLGDSFSRYFRAVEYFCSYPRRDDLTITSLNEVATVLVGNAAPMQRAG